MDVQAEERNADARKIAALVDQREDRRYEFKAARTSYDTGKAIQYCVAIANEGGGELILGMTDKLPRIVTGSAALPDLAEFERKAHEATSLNVVARTISHEGKRVVVVQIPRRRRGEPVQVDGRYLVRRGESLLPMDVNALREILDEARIREETVHAAEDLLAEQVGALLDVGAYFQLTNIQQPPSLESALATLEHKGLVRRMGDRWAILKAGALFLARDLEAFPHLSIRRVRVIKYAGDSRAHAVLDHEERRGYGIAFEELAEFVQSNVPIREIIDGGRRQTIPYYPPQAVREFLVNALVHQNLDEDGTGIVVEIFDNSLEIKNPGRPVIDVQKMVNESNQRNPDLAGVMRLAGVAELRGSGIDRALTAIEEFTLRAPRIETKEHATLVTLLGPLDISQMTDEEKAWTAFLHACLRYENKGRLTNSSLRARLGVSGNRVFDVSKLIASAVDIGLIVLDPKAGSSRRYAAYLPFFAVEATST